MLLENSGIRISVESPTEIDRMMKLGYVKVKGVKPKAKDKEEISSPVDQPSAVKLPAGIGLAVESLGLEIPEELSEIPDADILAVKGIGKGTLNSIRESFPLASEKEGE